MTDHQALIFRYVGNGCAEAVAWDRLYCLKVLNTGQCLATVQGVHLGAGQITDAFDICQAHAEGIALDRMKSGAPIAA